MNADTIHFHHLILQNSGSYLFSVGSIYLLSMISIVGALLSFSNILSVNIMILHLASILIFILTPPVQTYVPLISKIVGPLYKWQKGEKRNYQASCFKNYIHVSFISFLDNFSK